MKKLFSFWGKCSETGQRISGTATESELVGGTTTVMGQTVIIEDDSLIDLSSEFGYSGNSLTTKGKTNSLLEKFRKN